MVLQGNGDGGVHTQAPGGAEHRRCPAGARPGSAECRANSSGSEPRLEVSPLAAPVMLPAPDFHSP